MLLGEVVVRVSAYGILVKVGLRVVLGDSLFLWGKKQ